MGLLEGKSTRQKELEKKIKVLRDAGMTSSAERLEYQLKCLIGNTGEKIKPMRPHELAKQAQEHKALAGKA